MYFPPQWRKGYALPITKKDEECLRPGEWLTDTIVELGAQLIVDQELQDEVYRNTCFVMSTFFSVHLNKVLLTASAVPRPMGDFLYCFQAASGSSKEAARAAYDGAKCFLNAARPFEREFIFVPVHSPGHWALLVACRPLALVQQLLGIAQGQPGGAGAAVPSMLPSVVYADSIGSKGRGLRRALAWLLLLHYAESNVCSSAQVQLPDDCVLLEDSALGPEVSTPAQGDLLSCGCFAIHTVRCLVRDVVRPSLAQSAAHVSLESIMVSNWFTSSDALAERGKLLQVLEGLKLTKAVPARGEDGSTGRGDWEVLLDEIATQKNNAERERKVAADVMQLLARFAPENPDQVTRKQVWCSRLARFTVP